MEKRDLTQNPFFRPLATKLYEFLVENGQTFVGQKRFMPVTGGPSASETVVCYIDVCGDCGFFAAQVPHSDETHFRSEMAEELKHGSLWAIRGCCDGRSRWAKLPSDIWMFTAAFGATPENRARVLSVVGRWVRANGSEAVKRRFKKWREEWDKAVRDGRFTELY